MRWSVVQVQPKTEEHKQKLREANLGKTLSAETKRKISEASIGRVEKEHTCHWEIWGLCIDGILISVK